MILLNFTTKIKGTSQVEGHKEWIPVSSVSFNVARDISTSADGAADRDPSRPRFSDITLTKPTDISSADLFMQAVCGKSLGKAELHFLQTGGVDKPDQIYLKVELDAPIITMYRTGADATAHPTETIEIHYSKISYQYDMFDGATVKTGTAKKWDRVANKEWK